MRQIEAAQVQLSTVDTKSLKTDGEECSSHSLMNFTSLFIGKN